MENKEVMEYKNIRFELREDFEDEGIELGLARGKNRNGLLEIDNTLVLNTYNVYVDDEFKAIFANGKYVNNVFIYNEDEEKIEKIFASQEEMGSEELFEGIYRFMNSWKDRKVEVFGEIGKGVGEVNALWERVSFWYLLVNEDKRKRVYKWIDKLLTYGVKEGKNDSFSLSTISEYIKKDIGLEVNIGLIKGVLESNKNFEEKGRKFSEYDSSVSLNYNDTLDFFEEIDEKVKAT